MGLQVEHSQRLQRQVQHLVRKLLRNGRRPVQGVADPGCAGRELLEHQPRLVSCNRVHPPLPAVAQHGPPHFPCEGLAGGQGGDRL